MEARRVKYWGLKGLRVSSSVATGTFKASLIAVTFLFLTLSLLYSLFTWSAYASVSPEVQRLDLTLLVLDHRGVAAGSTHLVVFELAESGPRKLFEGASDEKGLYRGEVQLPRKLAREKLAAVEGGEVREVYASVNLWVVASKESDGQVVEVGTLTFSVDPTFMKHPLDSVTHVVKLSKIEMLVVPETTNALGSASSCTVPPTGQDEVWVFTTVLKFATWDNIQVKYEYRDGSKIRVSGKERYFIVSSCGYTPWTDNAGTVITFESGISRGWLTGRTVYTEKFEFKYIFTRYWVTSGVLIEKVYAADTSTDPRYNTWETSSWSGSLPGWSYYYKTAQLTDSRSIPITGKETGFTFSVDISFPKIPISISLSVTKNPSPVSYLYIKTGTWTSGYVAKTVSRDGTFLETYNNWVPP
ncbi:MAG: hypothetical protein ACP5PQ_06265 [Thermoproteota archaeon]